MSSLLDTNVVSQRIKDQPDGRVVRWFQKVSQSEMYLSVIALQEIRLGIEELAHGRKRQRLETWLTVDLRKIYAGQILPVTEQIAEEAGVLIYRGKRAGAEPEMADALIAATARVHGLSLATLNRKHFENLGVELVKF